MTTPIGHCRFNPRKGLWETHPSHWVWAFVWVAVAFPLATTLERGVPS